MADDKTMTPLVEPYDEAKHDRPPEPVDTDVTPSTDADGAPVELPDEGGKID